MVENLKVCGYLIALAALSVWLLFAAVLPVAERTLEAALPALCNLNLAGPEACQALAARELLEALSAQLELNQRLEAEHR